MTHSLPINTLTELDMLTLTRESLDVSEFEVFCRAYAAWHGDEPSMQRIENHFDEYLSAGILPFYVRHYCRQFIELHPENVDAAMMRERRCQFAERLVTGLLIAFVAGALLLA